MKLVYVKWLLLTNGTEQNARSHKYKYCFITPTLRVYSNYPPLWFCLCIRTIKPKRLKLKLPNLAHKYQLELFYRRLHYGNDAKTFLKHFSDFLFYFCSICTDSISDWALCIVSLCLCICDDFLHFQREMYELYLQKVPKCMKCHLASFTFLWILL